LFSIVPVLTSEGTWSLLSVSNKFLYHEPAGLFLMGQVHKMYSSASSERLYERVRKCWVQLISALVTTAI